MPGSLFYINLEYMNSHTSPFIKKKEKPEIILSQISMYCTATSLQSKCDFGNQAFVSFYGQIYSPYQVSNRLNEGERRGEETEMNRNLFVFLHPFPTIHSNLKLNKASWMNDCELVTYLALM